MSMEDRLKTFVIALASLLGVFNELDARLKRTHGHGLDNRGQLGTNTIIAAFMLVVVGAALIFALDTFSQSMGTPQNSALSQSQDSMYSGFSNLADLVPAILIIAGIVVLIGLIRRVQQ